MFIGVLEVLGGLGGLTRFWGLGDGRERLRGMDLRWPTYASSVRASMGTRRCLKECYLEYR